MNPILKLEQPRHFGTNELNWKPSGRHKFAILVSPAGLWDRYLFYPSAYADGSSSTALRANPVRG
jgi:hypothetical protein